MFLNKLKTAVPTADRVAIPEARAIGVLPGQRLIGYAAVLGAAAILIGGVYYKVVKADDTAATGTAPPAAPPTPPHMAVPQDPPAPLLPSAPAGYLPPSNPVPGAPPSGLPPGMANAGPNQQPGQQPNTPASAAAEKYKTDQAAAAARRLSGDFGTAETDLPKPAVATPGTTPGVIQAIAGNPPTALPNFSPTGADASNKATLSSMLVPTALPGTSASYIPNQHMTLLHGTSITCNLDTAIMTDQVGLTSCLTDYPVKSMDGKVVLMERGTKIDGEYTRGMTHGAKSIFVLWTKAVTPTGVVVTLASPGTDPLGRAGLSGQVDNKFFERYGGALTFSILEDGLGALTTRKSGSGNTLINLGNTQATGTTAAAEILKENSDVTPAMYKNQGESVGITIARDIDFSTVYNLVRATP